MNRFECSTKILFVLPGLKPENGERGDAAAPPYGFVVDPSADVLSYENIDH